MQFFARKSLEISCVHLGQFKRFIKFDFVFGFTKADKNHKLFSDFVKSFTFIGCWQLQKVDFLILVSTQRNLLIHT